MVQNNPSKLLIPHLPQIWLVLLVLLRVQYYILGQPNCHTQATPALIPKQKLIQEYAMSNFPTGIDLEDLITCNDMGRHTGAVPAGGSWATPCEVAVQKNKALNVHKAVCGDTANGQCNFWSGFLPSLYKVIAPTRSLRPSPPFIFGSIWSRQWYIRAAFYLPF